MKLLRWLRSRPLARVRRNLATEKRIREQLRADQEFLRRWHKALRGEYPDQHEVYRPTRNQRELFASKEDWKLP